MASVTVTVDHTRSSATTGLAALAPIFRVSNPESYYWYWSGATLLEGSSREAVQVAFGQTFGVFNGRLVNVHGAGAQRGDPKSGDPARYVNGPGPRTTTCASTTMCGWCANGKERRAQISRLQPDLTPTGRGVRAHARLVFS